MTSFSNFFIFKMLGTCLALIKSLHLRYEQFQDGMITFSYIPYCFYGWCQKMKDLNECFVKINRLSNWYQQVAMWQGSAWSWLLNFVTQSESCQFRVLPLGKMQHDWSCNFRALKSTHTLYGRLHSTHTAHWNRDSKVPHHASAGPCNSRPQWAEQRCSLFIPSE